MKNLLIVLVVLLGCFAVAGWLDLYSPWGSSGSANMEEVKRKYGYMIATWQDYNDADIRGLQVTIGTNEIDIDVPAAPVYHRTTEKGHWSLHAFYCDSHVDSPAEVEVARELENEDLEVDIGRFLPSHPGKIVCVKTFRISEPYPYPTNASGIKAIYPPPKGLIRVGMLECDLQMLPWNAEHIECAPIVVNVDSTTLSDGSHNTDYFASRDTSNNRNDEPPKVYTYRSDRADAPKLLVTVYHGRVTEVTGGAEETSDIPYQLPAPAPPPDETAPAPERSWAGWVFDLLFSK